MDINPRSLVLERLEKMHVLSITRLSQVSSRKGGYVVHKS